MRAFEPKPEPIEFDARVRVPGRAWLQSHPNARKFPDRWNLFRKEVQVAFADCCAYLGFSIPSGQIDHFIAKKVDRSLIYEWSNYRWAEPRVNQLKRQTRFLNPFDAQDGWILIDPVTLEYKPGPSLPRHLSRDARTMCKVLNDAELVRGREAMFEWCRMMDGRWDIDNLRRCFPLLASCVEAEMTTR